MRTRLVVLTVVGWLGVAATPASAKIPPFTVEVEPDPPVAGRTTRVLVELEMAFPVDELPGLLSLHPTGGLADRSGDIPLTLERVGPARYQAEVVIPEAGGWVLVAFPDRSVWPTQQVPPGYPDALELEVAPTPPVRSAGEAVLLLLLLLLFLGASLLLFGLLAHQSAPQGNPASRRRLSGR